MDMLTVAARQLLLFAHLIGFALAFAAILREDVALLKAQRLDVDQLAATGRTIAWLLGFLWVTGTGLIWLEVGMDMALLAAKPKLLAKLAVVGVLTLNGVLLHWLALPMLAQPPYSHRGAATLCAALGAVSSVSWVFASFLGAARIIAPLLSLVGFMALYFCGLGIGVSIAFLLVRPRIERLLAGATGAADHARVLNVPAGTAPVQQ